MQTNHEATKLILSQLTDLIDIGQVEISTNNTDYLGLPSGSDYVLLEKQHHIGFEVFEDEIRVDFFDDHTHYGRNYDFDENASMEEYVSQAVACLQRIFTQTLVKMETFRGYKQIIKYEWFFLCPDGRKESIAGVMYAHLFSFRNPFKKKICLQSNWRYHKESGTFVPICDDTVSVHSYDWNIMIEIRFANGSYSYCLQQYQFDEETCALYWKPIYTSGASFYDTEKNALCHAKEIAKQYRTDKI